MLGSSFRRRSANEFAVGRASPLSRATRCAQHKRHRRGGGAGGGGASSCRSRRGHANGFAIDNATPHPPFGHLVSFKRGPRQLPPEGQALLGVELVRGRRVRTGCGPWPRCWPAESGLDSEARRRTAVVDHQQETRPLAGLVAEKYSQERGKRDPLRSDSLDGVTPPLLGAPLTGPVSGAQSHAGRGLHSTHDSIATGLKKLVAFTRRFQEMKKPLELMFEGLTTAENRGDRI